MYCIFAAPGVIDKYSTNGFINWLNSGLNGVYGTNSPVATEFLNRCDVDSGLARPNCAAVKAPTCDWKDTTSCIFQGYSFLGSGRCVSCNVGNPSYDVNILAGYTIAQLNSWLDGLIASNKGTPGTLSEKSVVEEYRKRCDVASGVPKSCTGSILLYILHFFIYEFQ
jgi:hypothetical protein